MNGRTRKGRRLIHRYTSSEIARIYDYEDKWFELLFNNEGFKRAVSSLKGKFLRMGQLPELLQQPDHHCTLHRHDPIYANWDNPTDDLCSQFGIDFGNDLAYGPRYRIERHVLFDEPIGNLFHPLIRCETDSSPVPHISKISVMPPSKLLTGDELNWLFLDLEFLIVDRQPLYPHTPSESAELFNGLYGKDIECYRQRIQEAITKNIIMNPSQDVFTLSYLIEHLRDEHDLLFKQIASLMNMSEGAVYKRYKRATFMPPGTDLRIMPTPRKKRT